ncbi:MAG: 30S ribosomal protein S3, partial [Planctomycetota bacterium]
RLGGAEMARTEHSHEGSIPLHTLRAKVDYGLVEAHTIYGLIGVKIWIYTGLRNLEFENELDHNKIPKKNQGK